MICFPLNLVWHLDETQIWRGNGFDAPWHAFDIHYALLQNLHTQHLDVTREACILAQ